MNDINETMQNIEITFGVYLCYTPKFKINGRTADYEEFGEKCDIDPENADPHSCGNMQFIGKPSNREVLAKYGLSQYEYDEVIERLTKGLSFGCCGLCS